MKKILITGAGKRIGREMVLGFLARGWQVTLHYHQSGKAAEALKAELRRADLKDQADALELVQADLGDLSKLEDFAKTLFHKQAFDCIINNASYFSYDTPKQINMKILNQGLSVNLIAPILLSQAFYQSCLKDQRQGVIINMLDSKLYALNPDYFSYTISKAGLMAATQMMAMDYEPWVRVCGIAPGITLPSGEQSLDDYQRTNKFNPLKRQVRPKDIAFTALLLASNPFMNGEIIKVDCGQSILGLKRDPAFIEE